ncbi:DUF6308 family protein [Demequina pelophila]|uniref:DUF6308 family protein n=1 Tax=Demequina pelophila TaxID=1638984 RepID=UPI000781C86C|nr:DUF6308 family protein [Demequina pelophila]
MSAMIPEILRAESTAVAVGMVRRYFGKTPEPDPTLKEKPEPYDGASFETLGGNWNDSAHANTITAGDLLALSALSVSVSGKSAIKIMSSDFLAEAESLLAHVPADVSISDPSADALIQRNGYADQFWDLLQTVPGFGPTRTSKLIARKRPLLLPVYDSVVRDVLGLKGPRHHWTRMREIMTADGNSVETRATEIRDEAGVDPIVTPLRIVDVILWMEGKAHRN